MLSAERVRAGGGVDGTTVWSTVACEFAMMVQPLQGFGDRVFVKARGSATGIEGRKDRRRAAFVTELGFVLIDRTTMRNSQRLEGMEH